MTRLLSILCLLVGYHGWTQCGYPATLHTTRDYCVGSTLVVSSPHVMRKIVWYKDGQVVGDANASQTLGTRIIKINPSSNGAPRSSALGDITTDEEGNVYAVGPDNDRIIKWSPAGNTITTVGSVASLDIAYARLSVDRQGALYASLPQEGKVLKFTPGSTDGAVVATFSAYPSSAFVNGFYLDCQGAIYVIDDGGQSIRKWPPGASSGTLIIHAATTLQPVSSLFVDSSGNLFLMGLNRLDKWVPGATSGTTILSWNMGQTYFTDMWMDGQNNVYLVGIAEGMANKPSLGIYSWTPGMTSPTKLADTDVGDLGLPSLTMDNKGNFYATDQGSTNLYQFPRTSSIDSAYTPTGTGQYYTVVTDMQGYTTTSNTIVINTPQPGPPSIQISATATSTPVCTPITFTASSTNAGIAPSYQWEVSGVRVGDNSTSYTNNLFADGDQVYCIMTAQAGCSGTVIDTSNVIALDIDPHGTASIKIKTPKTSVCLGDTVAFTATLINGSSQPVYQWLLNGANTGDNSDTYTGHNFSTGDVVTCIITSDAICGLAKSNSIALTVNHPPSVQSGQVFTIPYGQSLKLNPVTSGDIANYWWTPPTGLSDPTIADPIAQPAVNTLYTLKVGSPAGCIDSGTILVNVYTPLSIPGAFTPNGDGHNDLFYVLGGPVNSRVEEFAIFNRYGAEIFHVHGVAPGDPSFAWNGTVHGSPAPSGTYVYMVVMQFADGSRKLYKGTVVLIR